MCSRHAEMGAGSPESVGEGINWRQVYLDALAIDSEAPGTVCTSKAHYVHDHRHPVPYRIGIVHNYRQADEHWHPGQDQAYRCPSDPFQKLQAGKV